MASLAQLISWWCTNKVPTIQQRIETLGSFRHKDDAIAMTDVGGLSDALNAKAPIEGIAIEAQARANSDISIRSALADESQARGAQDAYLYELIQALKTLDIPPYDNDTAALAGGLAIGDLYHKPDGSVWVLKPLDYSAGYSYDGLPVPGIGSEHLYLSLDSLESEIAALRSATLVNQSFEIEIRVNGGTGTTQMLFILPAYKLLSTVILMPKYGIADEIKFFTMSLEHSDTEMLLDLYNVPIGGESDNPYFLNKVFSKDRIVFVTINTIDASSGTVLHIKAITQ
jgi:hypothetical protein